MMAEAHEVDRILLPKNVKPLSYKLHLVTDMQNLTYSGCIDVTLVVQQLTPKNEITFHSLGIALEFDKAVLLRGNDHFVHTSHSVNEEEETVTLSYAGPAFNIDEQLILTLHFHNELGSNMCGFYRSKYMVGEEEKWMAVTQFEPVDARRAFPCWDEPALKATFEVILTVPSHLHALSNMPSVKEEEVPSGSTKVVYFQPTPVMSTYLVAIVIGEFENVSGESKCGIPIRVFAPLQKSVYAQFALTVAESVLDFFSNYFGIPYPLPKLDLIAIPDFAAGAMENWGLITFREVALLCAQSSSTYAQLRVAYVIAHEVAHQWFGNICSPEWWRELWLNEGFATWAGNLAVDKVFPEWQIWTQFCSVYHSSALRLDSLLSSHPIEVDIARPRDIDEIFDAISYNKGASVIRMLADFIGQDKFATGLNVYLKRHSYGNAVTSDLWDALSSSSGYPVSDMMSNWTSKVGYPVVLVETVENGTKLKLTQTRFLSSGPPTPAQDSVLWNIKFGVISDRLSEHVQYFNFDQKTQVINYNTADLKWFKANAGQSGVFRVQYSPDLLGKLKLAVRQKLIPPKDRMGLISDYLALSRAGLIELSQVLELFEAYSEETEYTVWSELNDALGAISRVWEMEPSYRNLCDFKLKLFSNIGSTIGWGGSNDPGLERLLRSIVLITLADCGEQSVVTEAQRRFELYLQDSRTLEFDLRDPVFRIAARNGGADVQESLKRIYLETDFPELKASSLCAIGFVTDPELIKATFVWAFESGEVRNQDLHSILAACSSKGAGQQVIWTCLKQNWDEFVKRFGIGQFLLARMVEYSTAGFYTCAKADEIEAFFKEHKANGIDRTVSQVLEKIRANSVWLERNRANVAQWLELQST